MLVHGDGVLDCSLQQFSLAIGTQSDRAVHLAWECTTVDKLASHDNLRSQGQPSIRRADDGRSAPAHPASFPAGDGLEHVKNGDPNVSEAQAGAKINSP